MSRTLRTIAVKIRRCRLCSLYKNARKAVPGEGPANARIFFIGQAPGREEDRTGRPFVGRAGRFLTEQLALLGIDRNKVFITSVVKHFPPANRMPAKDEVNACLPYLLEQIEAVNPKVVVLMGRLAQSIRKDPVLRGRKVVMLPHPSAAMRFPRLKKHFVTNLKYILK